MANLSYRPLCLPGPTSRDRFFITDDDIALRLIEHTRDMFLGIRRCGQGLARGVNMSDALQRDIVKAALTDVAEIRRLAAIRVGSLWETLPVLSEQARNAIHRRAGGRASGYAPIGEGIGTAISSTFPNRMTPVPSDSLETIRTSLGNLVGGGRAAKPVATHVSLS